MTNRIERYDVVSQELHAMSDVDVRALLRDSASLGSGIGGVRTAIEIAGIPVFVKKVPLTGVEREVVNMESTKNVFEMPVGCHYGVGSPGLGVWREVAANKVATDLVLRGDLACFAAMYHCRVIDEPASDGALADELADIDGLVQYWHDAPGVRRRVEAIADATAHVALFLEYIPTTVPQWLEGELSKGTARACQAIDLLEEYLLRDVKAMNAAGLFHFDAHFDNLLTNGEQIYFADFGLAMSPDFELSKVERRFLERNTSHDVAHTVTRLVDWLVDEFIVAQTGDDRDAIIKKIVSTGSAPASMNASARRVVERFADVAAVVNGFYATLHGHDRTADFPTTAVLQACNQAGLAVATLD